MTSFATAINCIDGRVINWLKTYYNIDYVDMITEPETDGVFADQNHDTINKLQ